MALVVKNLPASERDIRDFQKKKKEREIFILSLDQENPLEEGRQPTPVLLPAECHGQRSLVGYSP